MRYRSQEEFVGFLIILAIAVLIQLFFQKYPISNQARRWIGLAFMALFLSEGAFTGELHIDLFGFFALILISIIWVPITWYAKSTIMEIWMSVTIGLPLARYVVLSLIHH